MLKSILNKGLFCLMLITPATASLSGKVTPQDCEGVKLELTITKSETGNTRGNVEAIVSGAEKPVYYIFYKGSGALLSKEFTLNKLNNIEQGTYYCSIVDGKGCTKKTEFKIE
jgi:hypothetical protein